VKDVFGPEIYKDAFQWAREAGGEDMTLYYNEVSIHEKVFLEKLDELVAMGVDFDAIGLQSHYDAHRIATPDKILNLYNNLRKYGKELKVTEFSAAMTDTNLQGSVMRDTMICTFAEEQMNGFLMWGFWDGANFEASSPVYDKDWNLKPGGREYIDLVYNKWWTRDAKANTDADGKATINGFYGDYDVTVNANGQEKKVSVAFGKGYENTLYITLD
jgi:GH35 family endo-1,4-beta-xylanase